MIKFSIIIATKDRAALLDGALTALAAQVDAPPFEIIVVDNGSTDETRVVVASHPVLYAYEPIPNRGLARNRGLAMAGGSHVLFIDDDVVLPPHFLAAHVRAHARSIFPHVVSGPIVNVPSADVRPLPTAVNFSNAFFCTCNVSVPLAPLRAVGGFDESFDLYGWEDTELGMRLRGRDVGRFFAWDAYLWHIKPPATETLSAALGKTIEKARMAARFVRKDPSRRARLATGAYAANLTLGRALGPRALQPLLAGIATSDRAPALVKSLARARLLDSVYVDELARALADGADR
jgi:glycosyltransferase involved in cell wall biosynthesis